MNFKIKKEDLIKKKDERIEHKKTLIISLTIIALTFVLSTLLAVGILLAKGEL